MVLDSIARALTREITLILHPASLQPGVQVRAGQLLESFPDVVPSFLVAHVLYCAGGLRAREEGSGGVLFLECRYLCTLWSSVE